MSVCAVYGGVLKCKTSTFRHAECYFCPPKKAVGQIGILGTNIKNFPLGIQSSLNHSQVYLTILLQSLRYSLFIYFILGRR